MEFQELTGNSLVAAPPIMPWQRFSDWIGVEPGIVRGWLDRGYLPTHRIGKHLLVNVELLRKQLLEQES